MAKKFKVCLIRVLTSDDEEFVNLHGKMIMDAYPELSVESRCIPDQWEGIHSKELEIKAIPKIIELAHSFEDPDMFIVSCADDPGVAELRREFPDIPVTGGGESTAALSLKYGSKVGILGIVDYAPKAYLRMIPDNIHKLIKPEGVESTLDLMTPSGRENCIRAAKELKDAGCEVIALGCTGLGTIGIAKEIEEKVGIPTIDPVLAEGLFAYFEYVRKR